MPVALVIFSFCNKVIPLKNDTEADESVAEGVVVPAFGVIKERSRSDSVVYFYCCGFFDVRMFAINLLGSLFQKYANEY